MVMTGIHMNLDFVSLPLVPDGTKPVDFMGAILAVSTQEKKEMCVVDAMMMVTEHKILVITMTEAQTEIGEAETTNQ